MLTEKEDRMFSNTDLRILFIPLIIEQGLEYIVGLADSLMVAQVGESAVSGVSLVDFVMALLISLFAALATGGTVVAGQYLGAKNEVRAKASANQLMKFSLWSSLVIMALVYALRPLILDHLFGTIDPAVRSAANQYFMIVVLSVPFLALYNSGAAVFRTMGNSKLPMKIMLAMNLLNIAGNALLVMGFHMGVAGIAVPTLVSRAGAAFIVLFMARKEQNVLQIKNFLTAKFHSGLTKQILRIGLPFSLENGMFYLGRLVVLSVVALSGTAAIAANSVSGTLVMFEVLPGTAINLGLSVVIAQCVGAKDFEQTKYYVKKVFKIIYEGFVISSAVILALMPLIMRIYNLSPEATALTWRIIIAHAVMMLLIWPLGYSFPVVFRAAGDAKFPMAVSILSMIFCRIALSYVFAIGLGMGMLGTWAAMFVDWAAKSVIYTVRYKRGKWAAFAALPETKECGV